MIMKDEIISIEEVIVPPRGRPKELINGLAEKLSDIEPGKALKLKGTFGKVPARQRNKVSQIIRKHWKLVRNDKVSIRFDPEGVPQVSIRTK